LNDIDGIINALADKNGSMEKIERLVDLGLSFPSHGLWRLSFRTSTLHAKQQQRLSLFPAHGKMQILPWVADNVLTPNQRSRSSSVYNFNLLGRKLSENTAMRQRLLNTIDEQMRLLWKENDLRAEVDHTAFAIGRFIPSGEQSDFFGEIEGLKKNIRLRREQIASFIPVAFNEMLDARLQNAKGYRFCLNTQGFDENRITNVWGCGDDPDQRWDGDLCDGGLCSSPQPGSNHCVNLERVAAGARSTPEPVMDSRIKTGKHRQQRRLPFRKPEGSRHLLKSGRGRRFQSDGY
jgi:hypothetical protein